MANDTIKQIADNLGVTTINGNYLSGIAYYYGVNFPDKDLMADILTAVGGNPATSTDYLKDIVLTLGGTVTINANWMEAWEAITATPPAAVPVNTTPPALDATGQAVQIFLNTDDGSWTNSPTSFTYQWYRVPETGGSNDPIIGETANNYELQVGDEDYLVTCEVTAINATGSSIPQASNQCYVYDEDYFNKIYDNVYDGSTAQSYLQNRLMMGLKTSGAYAKLDYFNLYAIDGQGSALANWVDGSNLATENGTITWTADQGYTGDTASGYIDTAFDPDSMATNYQQDDASRYFFPYAFGVQGGPFDGIASSIRNSMTSGISADNFINQGTTVLPSTVDYDINIEPKSIHRTNASTVRIINGVSGGNLTVTSAAVVADTQLVLRSNANYSDHTVAAYAMGASMVSENTDFVAAWTAYINAI